MLLYDLGKFDRVCVIISVFSMWMFSFCRSPLSSLISVIQSLEYLVTLYSSNFANFVHIIVSEAPVVRSKFLESFSHDILASPFLGSSTI